MKSLTLTTFTLILSISISNNNDVVQGQRVQGPPRPLQLLQQKKQLQPSKVMCTADSLLIYQDCRMCTCPRPYRAAKCFRKTCDLRTKDVGQCPSTILRLDDNKLCPGTPTPTCRTDNDCPNKLICCFDFCKGNQCQPAVPLEPGMPTHRGLGFP